MRILKTAGLFLVASATGACAIPGQAVNGPQASENQPSTTSIALEDLKPAQSYVPTRGLPAQALAPGECAMFLWSHTDVSKFVFFVKAGSSTAKMLLRDMPVDLDRDRLGGDIFGEFFTEQHYKVTATQESVELTFSPGDALPDGARISGGRIKISDAEGWNTVLPVLGVRTCQAAAVDDDTR